MRDQENKLEDMLLDRLVDGELSDAEYRDAIGVLESHPDGWRRCALAFLEAQAWGSEFRAVRNEAPAAPLAETSVRRSWAWLYFSAMAAACAASFLLAFGVAMRLQGNLRNLQLAKDGAAQSPLSPNENSLEDPNIQFASNANASNQPAENGANPTPMGRYQLVVDGEAGSPQAVEMPVFAADDPRASLLLDDYATRPHEIIRALQKSGNEVQRRRNWIPMRGSSGAPMYVPVDELQITPVSNRSYQ